MVYVLVTLSWGGRAHGRTREQNYVDDLHDRSMNPKEKEIVQTVEKRRPEVYQQEDTPNSNDYRLQDVVLRSGDCFGNSRTTASGKVEIECKQGCRLTCVPNYKRL